MSPSPWVVTIYGETTFPGPGGGEAVFWPVPPHWAEPGPDGARVLTQAAGDELAGLARFCAGRAGRALYSAEWVITADRGQLRRIGRPGIAEGWPGLPSALAWLARNPGGRVAAGVLRWLAEPARDLPPDCLAACRFVTAPCYDRR